MACGSQVGPQRSRDIARDTCALRQYDIDAVCITFGCERSECRRRASDTFDCHVPDTWLMRLRSPW